MKGKYAILVVSLLTIGLTGCGAVDRKMASITGGASETCVDGVAYLQFTSGATVKYNKDGTVATCE